MGSSTTRYFDKGELRKLFMLGPTGKCDFLERLRERGLATVDMGNSGMIVHSEVIGVSSHDKVYNAKSTVTISENDDISISADNPFSTAHSPPAPAHYEKTKLDMTKSRTLGRSQRALFKGTKDRTTNETSKQGASNIKEHRSEKENRSDIANPSSISMVQNHRSFADVIHHANKLREEGQRINSLEVLMDLLEGKHFPIKKQEKIQLHEHIASAASELQWL